eukprot:SAG11_NODE_46518_length_135_cov_2619.972222_1_plen_31_part_10
MTLLFDHVLLQEQGAEQLTYRCVLIHQGALI